MALPAAHSRTRERWRRFFWGIRTALPRSSMDTNTTATARNSAMGAVEFLSSIREAPGMRGRQTRIGPRTSTSTPSTKEGSPSNVIASTARRVHSCLSLEEPTQPADEADRCFTWYRCPTSRCRSRFRTRYLGHRNLGRRRHQQFLGHLERCLHPSHRSLTQDRPTQHPVHHRPR